MQMSFESLFLLTLLHIMQIVQDSLKGWREAHLSAPYSGALDVVLTLGQGHTTILTPQLWHPNWVMQVKWQALVAKVIAKLLPAQRTEVLLQGVNLRVGGAWNTRKPADLCAKLHMYVYTQNLHLVSTQIWDAINGRWRYAECVIYGGINGDYSCCSTACKVKLFWARQSMPIGGSAWG